jgi:hypothetical protein
MISDSTLPNRTVSIFSPTPAQQAILRQIVEHAGDLASVLEAQFASCRTAPEGHCEECFAIEVGGDVPLLPADTERPIGFAADINGSEAMAWVLLWHEDGRVDGLEISWIEDPHPALADLVIVE